MREYSTFTRVRVRVHVRVCVRVHVHVDVHSCVHSHVATWTGLPPFVQLLPIRSDVCSMVVHPAPSSVPTVPCRGRSSTRRRVDGACEAPGDTVSRKGEPGMATACCRRPTCSRYRPASPIE